MKEFLDAPTDTMNSLEEIALNYGYTVEKHTVKTEDGYINIMFRIYKNSPFR